MPGTHRSLLQTGGRKASRFSSTQVLTLTGCCMAPRGAARPARAGAVGAEHGSAWQPIGRLGDQHPGVHAPWTPRRRGRGLTWWPLSALGLNLPAPRRPHLPSRHLLRPAPHTHVGDGSRRETRDRESSRSLVLRPPVGIPRELARNTAMGAGGSGNPSGRGSAAGLAPKPRFPRLQQRTVRAATSERQSGHRRHRVLSSPVRPVYWAPLAALPWVRGRRARVLRPGATPGT